nr:hypothetical protein [Prolixibacteraceae bacterium]
QLERFKTTKNPINTINFYLESIWLEATRRRYNFDKSKFERVLNIEQIDVTSGQLNFEKKHLLTKLKIRDLKKYDEFAGVSDIEIHPLFHLIDGEIESWEKT